jgi:anti-sigma factor ChrR (cupin superfamily)
MYQKTVEAARLEWTALEMPGVSMKTLSVDEATGGMAVLTHIDSGASIPAHWHTNADETVYVLEGDFVEDGISYGPGTFFVGKAGTTHIPHASKNGCVVITHFSAKLDFNLV